MRRHAVPRACNEEWLTRKVLNARHADRVASVDACRVNHAVMIEHHVAYIADELKRRGLGLDLRNHLKDKRRQ